MKTAEKPVSTAQAFLAGEILPEGHPWHPATNPKVAIRLQEMRASQPPEAIRTAQAVLAGKLPLAACLGISIKPDPDSPWSEWLFHPSETVNALSSADARNTLARGVVQTLADEYAINAPALDHRGRELAGEMYAAACSDALRELVDLAEGRLGWSPRLRARLCMACREELAELVGEWTALEAKGVA